MKDLTIDNAADLYKEFSSLIGKAAPVTLDISEMHSFDLAGVQLLISFIRECTVKKIPLAFTGTLEESVLDRLRRAGFCREGETSVAELESLLRSYISA